VLWQVGTNSVLGNKDVQPHASLLREGLAALRATDPADVVLIDPPICAKGHRHAQHAGRIDGVTDSYYRDDGACLSFRRFASCCGICRRAGTFAFKSLCRRWDAQKE